MYCGRVVEEAPVDQLFSQPLHPYTQGLLNSIPRLDQKVDRLYMVKGVVPNLMHLPSGCAFAPRCPRAASRCREARPELVPVAPGCRASCWLVERGEA